MSDDDPMIFNEEEKDDPSKSEPEQVLTRQPSTEIAPIEQESTLVIEPEVIEDISQYGKIHKRSRLCSICTRPDYMDINLARARDHMPYEDMIYRFNVTPDALRIHFTNHFYISRNNRNIIELRENSPTEANEFVDRMLEGDLDFFCAMEAVLKSKAKRINAISSRIDTLTDNQEIDNLGNFETGEFIQLNKLLNDLENDAVKVQELMVKKIFPGGKEEMNNAVMSYKYSVLTKMLGAIQLSLNELEQQEEYKPMIHEMRSLLASKINSIEDDVLRSGRIVRPLDEAPDDEGEGENTE